jgi:hypothetical protein
MYCISPLEWIFLSDYIFLSYEDFSIFSMKLSRGSPDQTGVIFLTCMFVNFRAKKQ